VGLTSVRSNAIVLANVKMSEGYVSKLAVKRRKLADILAKFSAMHRRLARKKSLVRTRCLLLVNASI
jgi:hypothetical protein